MKIHLCISLSLFSCYPRETKSSSANIVDKSPEEEQIMEERNDTEINSSAFKLVSGPVNDEDATVIASFMNSKGFSCKVEELRKFISEDQVTSLKSILGLLYDDKLDFDSLEEAFDDNQDIRNAILILFLTAYPNKINNIFRVNSSYLSSVNEEVKTDFSLFILDDLTKKSKLMSDLRSSITMDALNLTFENLENSSYDEWTEITKKLQSGNSHVFSIDGEEITVTSLDDISYQSGTRRVLNSLGIRLVRTLNLYKKESDILLEGTGVGSLYSFINRHYNKYILAAMESYQFSKHMNLVLAKHINYAINTKNHALKFAIFSFLLDAARHCSKGMHERVDEHLLPTVESVANSLSPEEREKVLNELHDDLLSLVSKELKSKFKMQYGIKLHKSGRLSTFFDYGHSAELVNNLFVKDINENSLNVKRLEEDFDILSFIFNFEESDFGRQFFIKYGKSRSNCNFLLPFHGNLLFILLSEGAIVKREGVAPSF
ncbi:MAG TPA: hypothetical protein DEP20_00375 [Fusobacteria bacterium]|nr:hypothetical protein [Fusobacteriota bacterium]|tara:strand:- start:463 stop:1929 length:1467 start_codon:yes stop_codon:yes gene_type:complete